MSEMLTARSDVPVTGLPTDIFTPGFNDIVETAHGRSIQCEVTRSSIEITDVQQPQFGFDAHVHPLRSQTDPHSWEPAGWAMEFGVRTVLTGRITRRVQRHPDMRAAGLFDAAVDYFDARTPLTHINGHWSWRRCHGNTNYRMFHDELKGIDNPTPEQLQAAAFATWTGRQALRHGFSSVAALQVERGQVLARLAREGNN